MRTSGQIKPEIIVNVYHASADGSSAAFGIPGCCGAYHTGVEINGVEYAFAGVTGVYECRTGDYGEVIRKETFQSILSGEEIRRTIDKLREVFIGNSYHVILNNCNNFSDTLVRACTGKRTPAWINRGAWWLSWFKCCFSFFESDSRNVEGRPLLASSNSHGPVRQMTPIFSGNSVTLSGTASSRPLSSEEQRSARLRNLAQFNDTS
jgi:hypothetical protein